MGVALVATVLAVAIMTAGRGAEATWCIARSSAMTPALQTAIDYACGVGVADCLPIQPNGLCYLPNTLQAHASYAFNSYYQRSGAAPGACDFAGCATVTITDPSYGSCSYPSSPSTAGGSAPMMNSTIPPGLGTPTNTPLTPPAFGGGGSIGGGFNPRFGPPVPNIDDSSASATIVSLLLLAFFFFLPLLF